MKKGFRKDRHIVSEHHNWPVYHDLIRGTCIDILGGGCLNQNIRAPIGNI